MKLLWGVGRMNCLLIYDITEDKFRTKAAEICKDYGLQRVQYSAFFGYLNTNLRGELARKLKDHLKKSTRSSVFMFPISEDNMNEVIKIDYHYSEDEVV